MHLCIYGFVFLFLSRNNRLSTCTFPPDGVVRAYLEASIERAPTSTMPNCVNYRSPTVLH